MDDDTGAPEPSDWITCWPLDEGEALDEDIEGLLSTALDVGRDDGSAFPHLVGFQFTQHGGHAFVCFHLRQRAPATPDISD